MLFCGIMFLFVCNHYIGYYREFYCILVVRRCIVIDQWKKSFNSYQCKFVLFFTELFSISIFTLNSYQFDGLI